jgi:hypothetical protein
MRVRKTDDVGRKTYHPKRFLLAEARNPTSRELHRYEIEQQCV